jgi:CubicO group peptidase (beta-lactamase class C family)
MSFLRGTQNRGLNLGNPRGLLMSKFFIPTPDFEFTLAQAMKNASVPGSALLTMEGRKISYAKGIGLADPDTGRAVTPDTLFTIASVSKIVTTTALIILSEQKKVNLDDDINKFLPFKIHHPNYRETPITFRMLLSHTSSIRDSDLFWDFYTLKKSPTLFDSPIPLGEFLEGYLSSDGSFYKAEDNFLKDKPGTRYAYCNTGFGLVGYLVECISGMPFDKYCREAIFDPLGMTHTAWKFNDVDINLMAVPYGYGFYGYPTYPDGALKTSINEFSRFLFLFMNEGKNFEGKQLLQPQSIKEMLATKTFPGLPSGISIGLGWHFEEDAYHHYGGDPGISTLAYFKPKTKQGVIFFSNGSDFDLLTIPPLEKLGRQLLEMAKDDMETRAILAKDGLIYSGYHPKMKAIHDRNAEKLREIIREFGWPTKVLVGESGSDAAWLILQHAIDHPDLLRSSLMLLKTASDRQEINPQNYACLYDRICLFEGRPQVYGTQFVFDENGEYIPWEIENRDGVDERRFKMGFPSLEETWSEHKIYFAQEEKLPAGWNKKDYDEDFQKWAKKSGWRS